MDKFKVSFIVPMFNEEKTIDLCLDSINRVKSEEDQVVVVDNGSTDKSVEIVKKYAGVMVINKPDKTVAAVRNAGAAVASGDVLAFIDADCILDFDWREQAVATLALPNVAATGSKVGLPENPTWIEKAWCSQRKSSAGRTGYINSGNFIVVKSKFVNAGGFNENLVAGEDSEFCWRLSREGCVVFENPSIKVKHLGNPKNLWSFFRQQRWHGLGMFGTFKISWLDKPVIMTFAFIVSILVAVLILSFGSKQPWSYNLLYSVVSILVVPVATALYRCFQYRSFAHFPSLILLYLIYYVARAESAFRLCYRTAMKFRNRQ